jgi:hypothetical protein
MNLVGHTLNDYKSITHQIDLISSANLPNQAAYKLITLEN